MKDIKNYNSIGELHGYHEIYWFKGNLGFKCFFYNGIKIDYEEFYWFGSRLRKSFYI